MTITDDATLTIALNASDYVFEDQTYPVLQLLALSGDESYCPCNSARLAAERIFPSLYRCCASTQQLYASPTICEPEIQYASSNGDCLPCPPGAYCPGDVRLWSLAGYWNPSELIQPAPCVVAGACLGSFAEGQLPPCCCAPGYAGTMCNQCADSYYGASNLCISCSQVTSGTKAEAASVVMSFLVFFALVAVAVAFFSDVWLDRFVVGLVCLQQLTQIGLAIGSFLPERLFGLFQTLSIVLFDYEFIRPGCTIGFTRFAQVFWGSLALVCVAWTLVMVASYVRFRCLIPEKLDQIQRDVQRCLPAWCVHQDVTQPANIELQVKQGAQSPDTSSVREIARTGSGGDDVQSRATRSTIITCYVVYIKLSQRILESINCRRLPDGLLHLHVESEYICYEKDHLEFAIVGWILFFVFVLGFPCFCLYTLYRISTSNRLFESKSNFMYGFLWRGLKPGHVYLRQVDMLIGFILAFELAFVTNTSAFTMALAFMFKFVYVAQFSPFERWLTNLAWVVLGVGDTVVTLMLLSTTNSPVQLKFAIVMVILGISLLLLQKLSPATMKQCLAQLCSARKRGTTELTIVT